MTDLQNQAFLRSFRHSAISMDIKDVLEIRKIASEVLSFKLFDIEIYTKYYGAPFNCYLTKGWSLLDYLHELLNQGTLLETKETEDIKKCIKKAKNPEKLKFEVIIYDKKEKLRFFVPATTKAEEIITFDPEINPYQRREKISFKTSQKYSKTTHPMLKIKDVEPILLKAVPLIELSASEIERLPEIRAL